MNDEDEQEEPVEARRRGRPRILNDNESEIANDNMNGRGS